MEDKLRIDLRTHCNLFNDETGKAAWRHSPPSSAYHNVRCTASWRVSTKLRSATGGRSRMR